MGLTRPGFKSTRFRSPQLPNQVRNTQLIRPSCLILDSNIHTSSLDSIQLKSPLVLGIFLQVALLKVLVKWFSCTIYTLYGYTIAVSIHKNQLLYTQDGIFGLEPDREVLTFPVQLPSTSLLTGLERKVWLSDTSRAHWFSAHQTMTYFFRGNQL